MVVFQQPRANSSWVKMLCIFGMKKICRIQFEPGFGMGSLDIMFYIVHVLYLYLIIYYIELHMILNIYMSIKFHRFKEDLNNGNRKWGSNCYVRP